VLVLRWERLLSNPVMYFCTYILCTYLFIYIIDELTVSYLLSVLLVQYTHSGNLLVTTDGQLCLIDFGLCTEVDLKERNALTSAMFHLLTQDFESLVSRDAKDLGFLPDDFDTSELKPLLTKILTVGLLEASGSSSASTNLHTKRKRKLQDISNELNEVFFRYPFSVPPFFALVTRGLGLLEGIALTGDPDFDIFQASAPYARRRALSLLGNKAFRAGLAPTDHATK
jgi:predicted unusual protein kinase regulating ubiquinone biosynthesis (AarF/ABC1/UbiB family)